MLHTFFSQLKNIATFHSAIVLIEKEFRENLSSSFVKFLNWKSCFTAGHNWA